MPFYCNAQATAARIEKKSRNAQAKTTQSAKITQLTTLTGTVDAGLMPNHCQELYMAVQKEEKKKKLSPKATFQHCSILYNHKTHQTVKNAKIYSNRQCRCRYFKKRLLKVPKKIALAVQIIYITIILTKKQPKKAKTAANKGYRQLLEKMLKKRKFKAKNMIQQCRNLI